MATDFNKNRDLVRDNIKCPDCKAAKGTSCLTKTGRRQYANHPGRIAVAFRKGIIK